MGTQAQDVNVAATISQLSPASGESRPTSKLSTANIVVNSWEDEELSSESEKEIPKPNISRGKPPSAPPPTPASPSPASRQWSPLSTTFESQHLSQPSESAGPSTRPEKTDAVARRMIAGALGLKAPKQTEEQKAYDKAIREKERKRREEEKAAETKRLKEEERAKAAIWSD